MSPAEIVAESLEALTNVVVRFSPFQRTVEPFTNPVPLTVSVKADPPARFDDGESVAMVGTGLFAVAPTAKETLFDVPPPGAPVKTVTETVVAEAMSAAVMLAVSCVALTKLVVLLVPFHRTVEPFTKPVPFTVIEKAGPPAVPDAGDRVVTAGTGLLAAFIVNETLFDVPPPGVPVNTVTVFVPDEAMSAAVILAVSCVPLTKLVVLLDPFHRTVEPFTKPVPFTVSEKAGPPTVADAGDRVVTAGTGLLAAFTVNETLFEVPPPGAPLNTVTVLVPDEAMSAAVMLAVSCVPLTKLVVLLDPFHRTVEPFTKPVPFTVSEKAGPPAVPDAGERVVNAGTGLPVTGVLVGVAAGVVGVAVGVVPGAPAPWVQIEKSFAMHP
jgi:hypothetical protein